MGVEGCTKCIKYLLFFFNFIFWLTGGVILGVALWLRHDPKISTLLGLEYDGNHAPSTFYISVHILIAVGAVMMVVGFLGCYGAIQESQCLLGTFFACLVILFACEVAAGIWGYMNRDMVTKEMKNFYDNAYDSATKSNMQEKNNAATLVLKAFHETVHLGGVFECFVFALQSCHDRINELFHDKIYLIGIAALVVAVIMIFEMIFSMVLCCGIRNSPVY
uniref:Tetraspanin n=1 Tax=Pundamilia nyererei TaxID=303518 RepID=A0A3B4GWS7_9CICH